MRIQEAPAMHIYVIAGLFQHEDHVWQSNFMKYLVITREHIQYVEFDTTGTASLLNPLTQGSCSYSSLLLKAVTQGFQGFVLNKL